MTQLIKQQMTNGALMMNYNGHGAPYAFSHELVMKLADFESSVSNYLPLWLTLLGLSVYLMTSLLLWPVFDKAGESPWKALIPVLNSYTLYEISGYKGWMCFLTLIPTVGQLIGCVLGALTAVSLARKFGKDAKWGIIYLFLLFFVGWVLIAVTNMTYNRSAGHQKDMSPFQII